jgi:DNA/RNA-binding domain of Phe-tRNA-synthetase-like protein
MSGKDLAFVVDPHVADLGIAVASAVISGLDNRPRGPHAVEAPEPAWARFSDAFIANDPTLRGYRDLHSAVGRSNKRFVSSTEALIRSVRRGHGLPRINTVVDIYNRLSLETLLSIGAHDAAKLSGDVQLRVTDGSERFVPLGSDEPQSVASGEYGYVDGGNDLLCRMECRQAEKSKLDSRSTDCIFIVQGNANTSVLDLQRTLDVLVERVAAVCGGRTRSLHRAI